jgi:hypothetical protein
MADESTFGGGLGFDVMAGGTGTGGFDSGSAGESGAGGVDHGTDELPVNAQPTEGKGLFGSGIEMGPPKYREPSRQPVQVDPQDAALNQSADLLQQRIERAGKVATNPFVQLFNPEGAMAARTFVPAATEQLLKIQQQKAQIAANRQQAQTLGIAPNEGGLTDQSTQADRVAVAQQRALKGDLNAFRGLQTVDPKSAEAIQDRVYEVTAGHLDKANTAFGVLSNMTTPQEYDAAVNMLRKNGTIAELETLGLKVPGYNEFQQQKAGIGKTLRDAQIGANAIRTKLEERNTYMPMEKKEAETYTGLITTAYGDKIENGVWSRNSAAGTRGFVVNGMADPRELGKTFTFATPDQRKAIGEDWDRAVPKAQLEKFRENNRTYELAVTDPKTGKKLPEGQINTNPNVQQGIAEGLAAALRGGTGGANVGLLKIEENKRGVVQGVIDSIVSAKAGALNTLTAQDIAPYLTKMTQSQVRYVMDFLHAYNTQHVGEAGERIAERAGALGLGPEALGLTKSESAGLSGAFERGRTAQIERMTPHHQAIGGGDGVLQLGAQRPGAGASNIPGGTEPTQQLPGAPAVATPVQQARNPAPIPTGGPGAPPAGPATATPAPQGPAGGGQPPAPVAVAGQNISVPLPQGASPAYVAKMQRVESGNKKDPWTATTGNGPDGKPLSSAGGAFQFIDSTWEANKPPGAPARAKDATPQQQAEALATFTAKNAQALGKSGLPVNDTTLYIAHNLGATGAQALLSASPTADARTIVGEAAAKNNPLFYKGKPTVATVLQRYAEHIEAPDTGPEPRPGAGGATAETPKESGGVLATLNKWLTMGVSGDQATKDKAVADVGNAAVEHAPTIGGVAGAAAGSVAGPAGSVAGGAVGGGAGQSFKDYLQGREQSPAKVAKEAALGGVLGVASVARPVVAAAGRVGGAAAIEAGEAAIEGKDAGEIVDAGAKGAAAAAGGEVFGRALGMAGHKVWSLFSADAKKTVQEAATTYNKARETLESTEAKLATGAPNPAYAEAETAVKKAEATLKNAGLNPEEAAYAAKAVQEGVPKAEAQVAKPGAVEQERIGKGYQQIEDEVGARGVGAPKPAPKLPDGPIAAVESKAVSAKHRELAERTEMAITAPAKNWQEKWVQLKETRSDLLTAERDALASTESGKTKTAADMRKLADTVRKQQEKVAKIVFGETEGKAVMERLRVLDTRYRNLMEATNGQDVVAAATLKGEAGRKADRAFRAFVGDDKTAVAAWDTLRRSGNTDRHIPTRTEHLPLVGKFISGAKLALGLRSWLRERAAGNPVTFDDLLASMPETGKAVRDVTGTLGARGAVAATQ